MRFKGMDLNLFAAFEALMETRSTARAGDLMGVSQPARQCSLGAFARVFWRSAACGAGAADVSDTVC